MGGHSLRIKVCGKYLAKMTNFMHYFIHLFCGRSCLTYWMLVKRQIALITNASINLPIHSIMQGIVFC